MDRKRVERPYDKGEYHGNSASKFSVFKKTAPEGKTSNMHGEHIPGNQDEFYDRGSTFPLNLFLNDGAPSPSVVGMPNVVSEIDLFFCTGVMGFFIKMRFGLG